MLECFNHDIQSEHTRFPRLLEQNKGKANTNYVELLEKLITVLAV